MNSFVGTAINLNVSAPTPTLSTMNSGFGRNTRVLGPGRKNMPATAVMVEEIRTPIKNALRNGRQVMSHIPFGRPNLLTTAIGAGTAGAVMGDGDFSLFLMGAGAGIAGGHIAEAGAAAVYRGLSSYSRKNAGKMSAAAFKAVGMGRMMTGMSSRGMIFGAGALLAGGMFSSMFASNSTSFKRGFNAQRGNSIVR